MLGAWQNFTPNCSRRVPGQRRLLDSRANTMQARQVSLWKAWWFVCDAPGMESGAQSCCRGASVVMKQDLNSTNTNTHNHCRWKSGYLFHLLRNDGFGLLPGFRKRDAGKSMVRKTGRCFWCRGRVIRFLHRGDCRNLRRPGFSVGMTMKLHKMKRLGCTSFSQASNIAEDKQLQTARRDP
jgi:hypothetical protein